MPVFEAPKLTLLQRARALLHRFAPVIILFCGALTGGLVLAWVANGGLVTP